MKKANEDFGINLNPCVLWQYNDAHCLQNLLQDEHNFFDLCTNFFWENYRNLVFNVATANRYGLERWADLIGVPTYYAKTANDKYIDVNGNQFTEAQVTAKWTEWREHYDDIVKDKYADPRVKVVFEPGEKALSFGVMTDDFLKRTIIAKFYLLDSNGSCEAINTYLSLMFGRRDDGEPKVVCREPTNTDGLNGSPYYWELSLQTGIGSYRYLKDQTKTATPMEISYDLPGYEKLTYREIVSQGKWDELLERGYSEEELYVLLVLFNRRMYLPHPAGVRINGQDEDRGLAFIPEVYLGFELEASNGKVIRNPIKFDDVTKIGPLNWSVMKG